VGPAEIGVLAFFAAVLVALSVIDIRTRRLPNRIVLPSAALVLAAQLAIAPDRALEWIAAALAAFAVLLAAHLAHPGGLGMGDVKLALLLGAALGWAVAAALVIGLLAAGLAAVAVVLRDGWAARKRAIPLGPFLALGGVIALFAGDAILDWYVDLGS
jgi:leader peptidase (prepilin peptidase)/N-methyltransferase